MAPGGPTHSQGAAATHDRPHEVSTADVAPADPHPDPAPPCAPSPPLAADLTQAFTLARRSAISFSIAEICPGPSMTSSVGTNGWTSMPEKGSSLSEPRTSSDCSGILHGRRGRGI